MELIEPPESALLFRLQSPAFDAPAPKFLHADRTPPDIAAACGAHSAGRFEARPISVWLLRDVFVACEGLVFDAQGRLFRPSLTQHYDTEIEWASNLVAAALAGAPIPRHELPLVLGKKRGAGNYGHWLLEMLPMLQLALHRLPGGPIGVLVHNVTDAQLGGVMQDAYSGESDRLIRLKAITQSGDRDHLPHCALEGRMREDGTAERHD